LQDLSRLALWCLMRLPPLNAIRAFEAVCRQGSISKAAEELGVVRGAVRQQLATLEAHYSQKLFERTGRALLPSAKARALAEAASAAFDILDRASSAMENSGRIGIRLGVPSAFAIWWLMPRVADMQRAMGTIHVDIVPMSVAEPLSLHPDLDGVIMGGEYRPAVGITAYRFMDDEFGPVATPALAASLEGDPSRLGELTILAGRSAPRLWNDWVSESGHNAPVVGREQVFEDLVLALGAARSGLGVAIAPRASIEDDLARGSLVAPFGFIQRVGGSSFCCRAADARTKPFLDLKQWLIHAGGFH